MKKACHGSCHCGVVRYEADLDLAAGTGRCNCSNCAKTRWCGVTIKPQDFRLLGGEYVSINLACLDGVEPRELIDAPLRGCDGRANDWMNPPAETRHF